MDKFSGALEVFLALEELLVLEGGGDGVPYSQRDDFKK
jgi:hypothetical protein